MDRSQAAKPLLWLLKTSQKSLMFSLEMEKAILINAQRIAELTRGHWTIENKLHHKKDRTMDENRYRATNGVARTMFCIRSIVTLILDSSKKSLNVIRRSLSSKPHMVTQLVMGKSLQKWKLRFLN